MTFTRSDTDAQRLAQIVQALMRHSFDGMKIVDAELRTVFVSPSVENVLGYETRDLLGTNPLDYVHPEDLQRGTEFLQRIARDSGSGRITVRARHKDGTYRHVEVIVQDMREDPDVRGFIMNYRDVSERIEAERKLDQFRELYEKAFRNCPDSITITAAESGDIVEVNEGFERITGYTHDEVVGHSTLELGIWKDPERRRELLETLERDGRLRDFEIDIRIKDGSTRSCIVSCEKVEIGLRTCILAVTRDITDQKEAQTAFRELRATFDREQLEFVRKSVALNEIMHGIDEERRKFKNAIAKGVEETFRPLLRTLYEGRPLQPAEREALRSGLELVLGEHIEPFDSNLSRLTPRELDIVELLKKGRSSKQIAESLGLSPQTIHKHRQSIRRKLQIDHRELNLATYVRSQKRPR